MDAFACKQNSIEQDVTVDAGKKYISLSAWSYCVSEDPEPILVLLPDCEILAKGIFPFLAHIFAG